MLRVLGSSRHACDGITRRDLLRAGSIGLLGLPMLLEHRETAAAEPIDASFGRAKRIILLYLYGAAAQHETFDPKPDAPAEIRGEFRPIPTAVPGTQICEHLPKLATMADRVTFVRSMTHPYNIHSAAYTLTGVDQVDIPMELGPYDPRHWPFFGSVLDLLQQQSATASADVSRQAPPPPSVPRNIALPFLFSSRCPEFNRGGPYGGFLGQAYNPVWTEFDGQASRSVKRWRGNADQEIQDPFLGITPDSRFTVSRAAQLQPEITLDRLDRRRSLLKQLEDQRRTLDLNGSTTSLDRFQAMAYSLMTSKRLREALDISREPASTRERYGMTLFGQATLAGRRLLEAGATLVSVFWDEYGPANSAWDTHFNHYERLSGELLPGLDSALTSLIADLEQRGLFDDTLILCLTEHGRTPKLSSTPRGAGREHWSNAYSVLLAGGGIARGKVIGRSDRHGAFVDERPMSPKDILCTTYHLMGVDPHALITDKLGRPLPLVSGGEIARDLLLA